MDPIGLDEAVRALDRAILSDPLNTRDRYDRRLEEQRAAGLLHAARPICPFLRPHIVSLREYDAVVKAAETLAEAFERIAARALEDPAVMAELAPTPREVAYARLDPGYARLCVSSRLDAYMTDGGFSFLEYNAESPAGIGDQLALERMTSDLPVVREFVATWCSLRLEPHRRLLEALLETYWEWGGSEKRPRIAIVDWDGVPTGSEFVILEKFFESEDYPTVVVDPRRLDYVDGTLYANGEPVDIVYKRVIIHEFLSECGDDHPLARAYRDGRVCLANSFRSKLAHKKASFAVASDPRFEDILTDEQRDAVHKHIPWTRRVREGVVSFHGERVPMRELLRNERERLVLKPNDSYGGAGIAIGYETAPDAWGKAVEVAFAEPFVVQEIVTPLRRRVPALLEHGVTYDELTIDLDPFLFNNRVEGALVRLSSTALSNVSSGGGETGLVVI